MTVWSQLRSYLSWPTEALLVGPETSSPQKWAAWGGSFVLGLGLSLASCASIGKAAFTMSGRDSLWSMVVVGSAVLFFPMVWLGLLLPRVAGPGLVLLAGAAAVCSLPALEWNVPDAIWVVLATAMPMFVVGAGFTWSGLKLEGKGEVKNGRA